MTRVYRDIVAGITYVERGSGGPLLHVPDHGEPDWQWTAPIAALVYDDERPAAEHDRLTEVRDRLLEAVGESKIPPTSKADVRRIIAEVLDGKVIE